MSESMHCEEVQRWIDRETRLDDDALSAALAHLEECEACAALFADAQYLRQRIEGYEAPSCPDEVVDAIWARVDAEEAAREDANRADAGALPWWSPAVWSRWLLPAAALGLVVFVFLRTPTPPTEPEAPTRMAQQTPQESTAPPCDLDLNEIYRHLGIDPARSPYDEETICEAAEEARTALAVLGKAMSSTREVIEHETRERMAETMMKGLGSGVESPTIHAPGSGEGG